MPRTLWIALSSDPAQIAEACGLLTPADEQHLLAPVDAVVDEDAWRAAGARTILRPSRLAWTDLRLRARIRGLAVARYVVISHGMTTEIEPLLSWWALGQAAEFLRYAPAWLADEQRYEDHACFWYTKRAPLLNRLGFRGDVDPAIDEGTGARIVCVGGSTTYGSGYLPRNFEMRADDSYPAHLARLGGWRVLNLGLTGLGAACQSARLLRYRHLRPDLVVVHAGYNDLPIVIAAGGDEYTYVVPDLERPACLGWLVDYYTSASWRARLRRMADEAARRAPIQGDTYLGHDLAARPETRTGSAADVAREAERRGRQFMRAIDRLVATALSIGARVLVIGQPAIRPGVWAWRSSLRAPESAPLLSALHREQQQALRRHLDRYYGGYRAYRYVDLADAFDRDYREVHIDEVHLGPSGNRRLAALLQPHAAELLAEAVLPAEERAAVADAVTPGGAPGRAAPPAFAAWLAVLERAVVLLYRVRRAPVRGPSARGGDDSPFLYPMR